VRQVQNALVGGVGMHRGHQAFFDAEGAMDDQSGRRQAIGGTGGIGDDLMFLRIIRFVVDPMTMVTSSSLPAR